MNTKNINHYYFHKTKQVTELGKKMATLPLEPPQAKLLLESEKFECSQGENSQKAACC